MLPGPGEPLLVLFCGINPSLYPAATGTLPIVSTF